MNATTNKLTPKCNGEMEGNMRFMLEDSIMVKDKECTAGSSILKGFKALINSNVYEKCIAAGFEFIGQVKPDEFGIDRLFDDESAVSGFAVSEGAVSEVALSETAASSSAAPSSTALASAASSSAVSSSAAPSSAVAAVLDCRCDIVLCNDVFGKIGRQAAENGLIYIRPAYGSVSRYGLIPSVSSMDQIGVLCRDVQDGIKALTVISGYDERDCTSLQFASKSIDESANKSVDESAVILSGSASILKIDNPDEIRFFDILAPIFYILASAEIYGNTNRYNGATFGARSADARGVNDMFVNTRSEGFGRDLKIVALVGCMALSKEHYEELYYKSMQIRGIVKRVYDELLSQYDAIMLPTILTRQSAETSKYQQLSLYALSALCGYVSVSFRQGSERVQLITVHGRESRILSYAANAAKT